jgi:hypothetical protein
MKVASREKIWSKNITKLETFQKNIYFLKVKWAYFKDAIQVQFTFWPY